MNQQSSTSLFSRKASSWFKGLAIIMVILSHYAEWWSWFYTLEETPELIRDGISRFGPYGVAIFLLFSGYGMAKSAGSKRIGIRFIVKRVTGVYIPYLITVLLIEYLSDGLQTAQDFIDVLYGHDFWYMTVLFLFYIAFILIWLAFANTHIRAMLMTLFTYTLNHQLSLMEKQDFWYISNLAFAIGVLAALYEPVIKKVVDKAGIILCVIFGISSIFVVRTALFIEYVWETPADEIQSRIYAVLLFTLFIFFLAATWKWYDIILRFLGNLTLYLYLLHTFLFMWAINYFTYEMSTNFIIAAILTLVAAILLYLIDYGITALVKCLYGKWGTKDKKELSE